MLRNESLEALSRAMSEPPSAPRRFDPFTGAAVVFFLAAVAFAAAPALDRGPETLASLLLLIGLAGVCCLGLFVLRAAPEPATEADHGAEAFLQALNEPAAVVGPDGRIAGCNDAWREVMGPGPRLPKSGPVAASLFGALGAARKGELGRGAVKAGGEEREVLVSPVGPRRFLVRMTGHGPGTLALPAAAAQVLAAFQSAKAPPPKVLDAFAAASPFGAALLEGEDPFAATILEANPALKAVAGGGEAGQAFGSLIEANSRAEAALRLEGGKAPAAPLEVRLAHDPTRLTWWTSPSRSRSSFSSARARRCRRSASSPAAWRTTSTTCSPPSSCSSTCWRRATR
jgi:two-component system, cell cycle sensor histidine kinase and response regulator CckA